MCRNTLNQIAPSPSRAAIEFRSIVIPCERLLVGLLAVMFVFSYCAGVGRAQEPADDAFREDGRFGNRFMAPVPPDGHANIFDLNEEELAAANRHGRQALLQYAPTDTTLAAPYYSIDRLYYRLNNRPLRGRILTRAVNRNGLSAIGRGWSDIYANAGLWQYPQQEGAGPYFVPFPMSGRPSTPIGFTVYRNQQNASVFTLSCAACHARNLFGRTVLGGTNLQGGTGNSLMLLKRMSYLRDFKYRIATGSRRNELGAFHAMQNQVAYIHGKHSQAMGLENPVAFVGLTLAGRASDQFATKDHGAINNYLRSPLQQGVTGIPPP